MLNSPWRIQLLGGLSVQNANLTITRFRTQRTGALLAYLAYYPHRAHPREELIALIWPDADIEAGRVSLRTALASLRRQLEAPGVRTEEALTADRANVQLQPEAIRTDVAEFEAAGRDARRAQHRTQQIEALERRVASYGGPLLPGYYENWILTERQQLADAYQEALSQLAMLLQQEGQPGRALEYAQRSLALDPLNEESHCLLMRLFAAGKKREAVLRQYALLEKTLRTELDAEPAPETQRLLRQLLQAPEAKEPAATAPAAAAVGKVSAVAPARTDPAQHPPLSGSPQQHPTLSALESEWTAPVASAEPSALVRLPIVFTRFFGRERERAHILARLAAALESSAAAPPTDAFSPRLFTLTGPGGMGKTRIAIELGRSLAVQRHVQTLFVDLADVRRPAHILPAIAGALQLASTAEESVQTPVLQALRAAPTLLILDNFEQLLEEETADEAVRIVQMLYEQAPSLICLITSRRRLSLPGEAELPLPPLPLPEETDTIPVLLENPSVRLFLDRARAVRPDFQITLSNSHDIAALSRALEGMPLAIELLAVWVQTLSPAQMRQRLTERMNLLQSRQRGVQPRHSGLRACIDWSYQLLPADLQSFFAQLSIFRGGWSLEAAEAVCAAPQALEMLTDLRERSLIVAEEIETPSALPSEFPVVTMRYRLLETLRAYADEQLTPELRAACELRHLNYFAAMSDLARERLASAEQAAWLARLSLEYDNIRAAFARCAASPESQLTAMRMGVNLCRFWENRGYFREGLATYRMLLSLPDAQAPTRIRALALNGAGNLSYHQLDQRGAQAYYDQSLALSRALDEKPAMALTLSNLGNLASDQGRYAEARTLYTESLRLKRETGSTPANEAHTLNTLGNVHFREQDYAGARALYRQALVLHESVGNGAGKLVVLTSLAATCRKEEKLPEMYRHYRDALLICREIGEKLFTAICLEGMAYMAFTLGRDSVAVQLYSAGAALRDAIRSPIEPAAALDRDQALEALRARLGEAFASTQQRGREMTVEQAVETALQISPHGS